MSRICIVDPVESNRFRLLTRKFEDIVYVAHSQSQMIREGTSAVWNNGFRSLPDWVNSSDVVLINSPDIIEVTRSKVACWDKISKDTKIRCPKYSTTTDGWNLFPCLKRKDFLAGGRGITLINNARELPTLNENEFLVQYLRERDEYRVFYIAGDVPVIYSKRFEGLQVANHEAGGTAITITNFNRKRVANMVAYTREIAKATGLEIFNVDFVVCGGKIYFLEINSHINVSIPKNRSLIYFSILSKIFSKMAEVYKNANKD